MLKAAIVGAGYIAGSHADAYRAHPNIELSLTFDDVGSKATALAAQFGGRVAHTFDQVLDSDVDLVSVCTPSPTHADLAIAALTAGKSVLCEKPIARTLVDARRMVAAAKSTGGLLMVGHVSRFEPDHRAARDAIAAGNIGTVRMMSQSLTSSFPGWSQNGWLADTAQSGGPLLDLGVHSFDFLNWISGGRPIRVHAVGSARADGLIDYALTTIRYDNGAMGVVETGWAHPENAGLSVATEIAGTSGRLSWDYSGISVGSLHTRSGRSQQFSPLGARGFRSEIAAFAQAVRNGLPSPVPAVEAELAAQVSLAALQSIESGAMVDLPPLEDLP